MKLWFMDTAVYPGCPHEKPLLLKPYKPIIAYRLRTL